MHIFAEACLGYAPVFAHADEPRRSLSGLVDAVAFVQRYPIPLGIRTQVRDFLPALAALGADEHVAVLDGGSGSLAMAPRRVRAAIGLARRRLGPQRYQDCFEQGRSLGLGALERYLDATLLQLGVTGTDVEAAATPLRGPSTDPLDQLTGAERRIAEAVAAGMSNREIGASLHLSVRTVESHLTHIYRKLGVRSRAQLVALALGG